MQRTSKLVIFFALATGIATGTEKEAVTFTSDVAPIFVKSCMTCDRPGEIAPMSLFSFAEARPWACSIKREVQSRAMPPWHADPAYGYFSNERRLTDEEYELEIDGDTATGTVISPAGSQDVTAHRQLTQLFAGDAPEPYEKTWRGSVEKNEGDYEIVTRRHRFTFLNADAFEDELESFVGKGVEITGFWRVDEIEIHSIEPWERRR